MHQACLGVMRKLLVTWMRGKGRLLNVRMSSTHIQRVSDALIGFSGSITRDFQRKPRHLKYIDRWKATELRQFLLYTGKFCLKDILRSDLYEHFMAFSIALCILVSPSLAPLHHAYAEELLVYFNEKGRDLYGQEFLVYNVHSLVHLADEAREFGHLDACAAFPFENYLQYVKKLVRSGRQPIVQIVKRLHEIDMHPVVTLTNKPTIETASPNNCYILSEHSCCEVEEKSNEKGDDGNLLYLCRVYRRTSSHFTTPCDSKLIGVQQVHNRNAQMMLISERQLNTKAMKFNIGINAYVFMSLLHCI